MTAVAPAPDPGVLETFTSLFRYKCRQIRLLLRLVGPAGR
jgi:hypothetical protein